MRQSFVIIHRYVGLVMALFLVLAGFTGTFIAFYDELETLAHPEFMLVKPAPNQAMVSPVTLAEGLQKKYPDAMFSRLKLQQHEGESMSFFIRAKPGFPENALINNEIFVNPYTGEILAERKWGDITQGTINLLPFIYRLHFSLALEKIGRYALGIVALIWSLDCFVGAYLTFPAPQRKSTTKNKQKAKDTHWLIRWWKAWKVRWQSGFSKVNFDLHRAGGLWVWAMLFVFAWSSVAFNLREVYNPVMDSIFVKQNFGKDLPKLSKLLTNPDLDLRKALDKGRELMQQVSIEKGFKIHHEARVNYDANKGVYSYIVNSDLDISEKTNNTAVMFSATSGKLLAVYLPTSVANGDTITEWLLALHMAHVWGLPMQIFVSAMGLLVVGLTVTGIIIWFKKRKSRAVVHQIKNSNSYKNLNPFKLK